MRAPQFETVVTIKYQLNLHCEKASTEANGKKIFYNFIDLIIKGNF